MLTITKTNLNPQSKPICFGRFGGRPSAEYAEYDAVQKAFESTGLSAEDIDSLICNLREKHKMTYGQMKEIAQKMATAITDGSKRIIA